MAGTTPVYGFPYPTASDTPAGHTQMQSLATAIENKIVTVDATFNNTVRLLQELEASATSDFTLPATTPADVPGATLTFTTTTANQVAIITATWDFRCTVTGTGYCYGEFVVDGVLNARKSLFVVQSAETRLPGFIQRKVTLASAGSHTIKLQGHKDSGSGTAIFCADTTVLAVSVHQ
jgi:hypothetical protein